MSLARQISELPDIESELQIVTFALLVGFNQLGIIVDRTHPVLTTGKLALQENFCTIGPSFAAGSLRQQKISLRHAQSLDAVDR